jgi:hypothetical protein
MLLNAFEFSSFSYFEQSLPQYFPSQNLPKAQKQNHPTPPTKTNLRPCQNTHLYFQSVIYDPKSPLSLSQKWLVSFAMQQKTFTTLQKPHATLQKFHATLQKWVLKRFLVK